MKWYDEQTSRLDKFKLALNMLRLQPDAFALHVPLEWALSSREDPPPRRLLPRAHSGRTVPYMLRINARSQLTFVPAEGGGEGGAGGGGGGGREGERSRDGSREDLFSGAQPRVYFMDMLRHVRTSAERADTVTLS